jgi:hypothetical protein
LSFAIARFAKAFRPASGADRAIRSKAANAAACFGSACRIQVDATWAKGLVDED